MPPRVLAQRPIWAKTLRGQLRGGFYNASSGFGLWAKTLRGQLRGGFYNASSGFGPEAKTLRGQIFVIVG